MTDARPQPQEERVKTEDSALPGTTEQAEPDTMRLQPQPDNALEAQRAAAVMPFLVEAAKIDATREGRHDGCAWRLSMTLGDGRRLLEAWAPNSASSDVLFDGERAALLHRIGALLGSQNKVHWITIAPLLLQDVRSYLRQREDGEAQSAANVVAEDLPADPDPQSVIASLTKELEEARNWADICTRGKSPCGHWKAYAHTEDGGKCISCLQCELEEARKERDELRAAIWPNAPTQLLHKGYVSLAKHQRRMAQGDSDCD